MTFFVPEVFITVSVEDARRIVRELRRSACQGLRPERLRIGERLEETVAGVKETQHLVVADLPEAEQAALLRAVEHRRLANASMSKELQRLHSALKGWVPLPQISYEVIFGYGGANSSFTSFTGRYQVGDRLPPTKDECWEVTDVEPAPEGTENARLIVQPCQHHA